MISAPSIGALRMDTYKNICFKGNENTNNGVRDKVNSELLRMIQPAQEEQHNNDTRGLERAVSTKLSFVKDNYRLTELNHVYRELKDNWDKSAIDSTFPMKGGANNKDQYTVAIIKARELLISHDSNWKTNRKREIQQQNENHNSETMGSIGDRLMKISNSYFCKL